MICDREKAFGSFSQQTNHMKWESKFVIVVSAWGNKKQQQYIILWYFWATAFPYLGDYQAVCELNIVNTTRNKKWMWKQYMRGPSVRAVVLPCLRHTIRHRTMECFSLYLSYTWSQKYTFTRFFVIKKRLWYFIIFVMYFQDFFLN